MHVAPSVSGKLRVVDEKPIESIDSQDMTDAPDTAQCVADVSDSDTALEESTVPPTPSVFATQDVSSYSRSSSTYSTRSSKRENHITKRDGRSSAPQPRSTQSESRDKSDDEVLQASSTGAVSHTPRMSEEMKSRKSVREHKAWKRYLVMALCTIVLVVGVGLGAVYMWDSYFRYDDAQDIQGTWYFEDGAVEVVIDEHYINLPEHLQYAYTIDTWAKTITFSFTDLSGSGAYEFSEDRSTLTISEGENDGATVLVLKRATAPEQDTSSDATPTDELTNETVNATSANAATQPAQDTTNA